MTVTELAEKSGIKRTTLWRWTWEDFGGKLCDAVALAKALDVPLEELMVEKPDNEVIKD